jgi:outer membrane murein-binding lipoprotein Lpp
LKGPFRLRRLVRALLRAGAAVDGSSTGGQQVGSGSPLHHALTARESTVLLARELQTMQQNAATTTAGTLFGLLSGSQEEESANELSTPKNDLLAEAATLSEEMAELFSAQARAVAEASRAKTAPPLPALPASALRAAVAGKKTSLLRHLILVCQDRLTVFGRFHAGWQQTIALALLAHARSPPELVSAVDQWGRTPLHLVCKSGNSKVLRAMNTSQALFKRDIFGRCVTANCTIIDHFSAFEPGLVAPFLYAAG